MTWEPYFYSITIYEGPHFQRYKSISTSECGVNVDILYYYHLVTHSICMSVRPIGIWVCEDYDCRWLLKTFISKIFGFAVLKSLQCIILCQCHHSPLHIWYFFSCISRFLLVNLSKFGAGMLIKCCILPSRNIKSAKASGAMPRWGAYSAPPNPLAGFKPILCLVVFLIGPKLYANIAIS